MAKSKKANDFIDLHALLKSYASKWYYFVISMVICGALGYLYTRSHARPMAVRANILISPESDSPLGGGAMGGLGSLFGSNAYVDDEIFVISSHSLFRNVARDLELNKTHMVKDGFLKSHLAYPDFPIDVVAPGVADTLRQTLVFVVKVDKSGKADIDVKVKKDKIVEMENVALPAVVKCPYGDFTVTPTAYYHKGEKLKTTIVFSGYESAAESLTDNVVAEIASRKSNVIELGYDISNPALGSAVLNEILAKYNERGVAEKNLQGEKTASFLNDRIQLLAKDLNEAEVAIQNYKEGHGIIDVLAEAEYQTAKKGTLESAMLEQETEMEVLRLTRDYFTDPAHSDDLVPMTVSNEAVARGIEKHNELVLKRLELLESAKPDNFAVKQLTKQIDLSRANLITTTDRVLESANLKLNDIRAEKNRTDSRLGSIPTQEREYLNMKRQQEVKQELYLFLLQRQEENSMMLANAVSKGKIIDEAFTLSEPLGMSPKMILFIALVIGLIIPPFVIYLRKVIRNKLETREEAEKHLTAPVLGEMCIDRSGRRLVVSENDTSSATELFRLLRSNLQFMLSDPNDKVVLMTSTRSGEGKSFISINLAASLSILQGKKVLLVGMDIRNPQIANYLGINPPLGLTNYLSSDAVSLKSIIVPMEGLPNLDLIVAGPIPPNPAELLNSRKVDDLFAELRKHYDYIVVDSAPVGMVSDTFTLDRISDATIYVTRVNYSSLQDLRFIEDVYEEKRLKKLSVVINGTTSKKGYGYGQNKKN